MVMVMLMRVMVMILMNKIVERANGNDTDDDTDDTNDDDDDDTYDTGDDNDVASRWEVVMEATEAVTDDLAQCEHLQLCRWARSSSSLFYAWTYIHNSDHSALVSEEEISHLIYDAMKDQPYISVLKISEFESGPRVVKMVLNTQYVINSYGW